MNKKNNKTIDFETKKREFLNNDNKVYRELHNSDSNAKDILYDQKIIEYDMEKYSKKINKKMNDKNSKIKDFFINKNKLVLLTYLIVFTLLSILIFNKINNNIAPAATINIPTTFTSENISVSSKEQLIYTSVINETIQDLLGSNKSIKVQTEHLHKNANNIIGTGYFNYQNNSDKIYFDTILNSDNNTVTSLLINGTQLIK